MDVETEFERYRDEQAIRNLKYRYCWAIDANDVDGFAELFTEDGRLAAKTTDEAEPHIERTGRDELRGLVELRIRELNRRFGQHRAHNPVIEVTGDEATGRWYFTAVNMSNDGLFEFEFGEYHEVYRRTAEGWKIQESLVEYMEVEPVLRRDL